MIRSLQIVNRFKAEAARLEQEEVGTPSSEALFASNEGVKRPTVLAAGAGYT
ncbi:MULTISPECIES: hypothetical protein [Bacillus]|uniref:hypothetical protein n=1 Tax=Bacillus TaxID=1386 RepID=UPI0002FB5DA7|nr:MULTISPECIES: hypothetical protein [Bacillus]AHA08331.1 hypothetical protein Btoyo_2355 [Bacillus toyonensis BCT-7112]MDH8706024.1 hypothetical protein [Stenotrophomonas sp. 1198]MBY7134910.1 hypothetical protein [Bacillus sp. 12RED03]MCH5469803.1 hypothetical protein [Bacillus toyonensis]MCU4827020.1 hypothetical protein [Bacillus toyonensis]